MANGVVGVEIGERRARSAADVRALLEAERARRPFLLLCDDAGAQVIVALVAERPLLTVGRDPSCDIALPWDERVSRTHALLERLGHVWTLTDDGLSRNGSFVNDERVAGRRRLVDGDVVRLGTTLLTFRDPGGADAGTTSLDDAPSGRELTPMQRKVLVALCRPFKDGTAYATPASNAEIAGELVLSVEAVKTHMRGLFDRFAVGDLPQNQKRARVAELALRRGIVSPREL